MGSRHLALTYSPRSQERAFVNGYVGRLVGPLTGEVGLPPTAVEIPPNLAQGGRSWLRERSEAQSCHQTHTVAALSTPS